MNNNYFLYKKSFMRLSCFPTEKDMFEILVNMKLENISQYESLRSMLLENANAIDSINTALKLIWTNELLHLLDSSANNYKHILDIGAALDNPQVIDETYLIATIAVIITTFVS